MQANLQLDEVLRKVADARRASVAQFAIAWVLAQGQDIAPVVGARRLDRLAEALGSLELDLTLDDLSAIGQAVPNGAAAGGRYPDALPTHLDSEK